MIFHRCEQIVKIVNLSQIDRKAKNICQNNGQKKLGGNKMKKISCRSLLICYPQVGH